MRLLVVGFADSVHVARYLQLLEGTGWDVHLFDSHAETRPHPELRSVKLHPATACEPGTGSGLEVHPPVASEGTRFRDQAEALARLLVELEPDVVHSHELQLGGALVDEARRALGRLPAPWLVTNWGSDILWFGRDPAYAPRIRSILAACDYYCAECHRDVALARAFGLRGRPIGVWPVAGGIDVEGAVDLRASGKPSERRAIAVKGATGAVGQGRVAAEAVSRCADLLEGWEICAYQAHPDVSERLRATAASCGGSFVEVSGVDARRTSHEAVLAMHGRARVSLGLNRSDAMSTSFLEAMAMGSFPVQSSSSCGREISPPGRGALYVPATDADAVERALRRALTDDALVDAAAELNLRAAREHLSRARTRDRVVDAYHRIVSDRVLQHA